MKLIIIAGGALAVGVGVAAVLFLFVLGGGEEAQAVSGEPTPEPTPVVVPGKLGPHLSFVDGVYTLQSEAGDARYVKLDIVIEFETFSEDWAHVLHGCVFAAEGGEEGVSPCKAEENELLHDFEEEIGSGRALIEDAITSIVSSHSYEDLSTGEGRERLRTEIQHEVEDLIHEPKVSRVLFLEFLTQ